MVQETPDRVEAIRIEDEMRQSYLDYAMTVIVSRALPDVRDGLKPVQRRILYGMQELGVGPTSGYRKTARSVGDVMGKFHPHGDTAIYDALVRMAQDFTMRYPLIDGQGNFGSIDGDPPAQMRYTEARLAQIAALLLGDIDRDTVDFQPNFDDTTNEPLVLPALLPNMLINGASGIAVGMATNIPPHNLNEICDALIAVLANPDLTVDELLEIVKGPDFPTGATIFNLNEIRSAFATGRGKITMQATLSLEETANGRSQIIVSELPYQVNKATLLERIADLVRSKRIEGISDIRDESDRHGMRVVIELGRSATYPSVRNQLYKHTALRSTFAVNMLALDGGQPKTMTLKEALTAFIEHRREVIRRRTEFDLEKAQERAHILEGLRIALELLDQVIQTIRGSDSADAAKTALMEDPFELSDRQAQAVLDMQLRRLAALERQRIEDEYQGTRRVHGLPRRRARASREDRRPDRGGLPPAQGGLRRRAPHPGRPPGRRGHQRRGPGPPPADRCHHLRPWLHETRPPRDLPPPTPRRSRRHRPEDARRGRHPPPHRVRHPRRAAALHQDRPRLLAARLRGARGHASGPRHPGRQPRRTRRRGPRHFDRDRA